METVSGKLGYIHSCQTQIQERANIHSPEMILQYIKTLPAALCLPYIDWKVLSWTGVKLGIKDTVLTVNVHHIRVSFAFKYQNILSIKKDFNQGIQTGPGIYKHAPIPKFCCATPYSASLSPLTAWPEGFTMLLSPDTLSEEYFFRDRAADQCTTQQPVVLLYIIYPKT